MPSQSNKQHRLMEGIAHGWHPSGMKSPPPVSVAKEFAAADEGKHFATPHSASHSRTDSDSK